MLKGMDKKYYQLSHALMGYSNQALSDLLSQQEHTMGWGINQQLTLLDTPVFVKRIPLTSREYEAQWDTRNLFDLPMFYHYGVGSAGFGVFRELLVHLKTTDWVLSGESTGFPLLYHHRILKSTTPWKQMDHPQFDKHVTYWAGDAHIAEYLQERMKAPYELVLFLEFWPESLHSWFQKHPDSDYGALLGQAESALNDLNQRQILHLDAHLANILTDGEKVVVSDFGLALDATFQLDDNENDFFDQHRAYDRAELVSCLGPVWLDYLSLQNCAIYHDISQTFETKSQVYNALFQHLPELELPDSLRRMVKKFQSPIVLMSQFYQVLRENPLKDNVFDQERLAPLLRQLMPIESGP